jgi:hypothetical protein
MKSNKHNKSEILLVDILRFNHLFSNDQRERIIYRRSNHGSISNNTNPAVVDFFYNKVTNKYYVISGQYNNNKLMWQNHIKIL